MIKKITIHKPIIKTLATTALLTTAVMASNASNRISINNSINQNQTEIISRNSVEALKINSYNLKNSTVEHNKDLDNLYLKLCNLDQSIKYKKNTLNSIYNVYGTFGATIEIQREIDNATLEKTFELYLNHYNLNTTQKNIAQQVINEFKQWQNDFYYTKLTQSESEMYNKIPFPNAKEAINAVDKHITHSEFFTKEDIKIYHENSKKYQAQQDKKESIKAKSNLLAYKIHLLNTLAFNNAIKTYKFPEAKILEYYFLDEFVNRNSYVKP